MFLGQRAQAYIELPRPGSESLLPAHGSGNRLGISKRKETCGLVSTSVRKVSALWQCRTWAMSLDRALSHLPADAKVRGTSRIRRIGGAPSSSSAVRLLPTYQPPRSGGWPLTAPPALSFSATVRARHSRRGSCMTTCVQRTKRAERMRPEPPSGPRSDIACSRRGLCLSCSGYYANIPA